MQKRSRLFQLQAGLAFLLTAIIGIGHILPASAHPYQIFSQEEYRQEQAKWREMIKRDPKNPEPYLQLGASYSSEAAEGYWCETAAIAVYREAIAAVPPNAQIHLRLGQALMSEPFRCDNTAPVVRQAEQQEGLFHIRKAITIAAANADLEELYAAADALKIQNR